MQSDNVLTGLLLRLVGVRMVANNDCFENVVHYDQGELLQAAINESLTQPEQQRFSELLTILSVKTVLPLSTEAKIKKLRLAEIAIGKAQEWHNLASPAWQTLETAAMHVNDVKESLV